MKRKLSAAMKKRRGVTQTNKSILELPHLVWREFSTYVEGRENCLLNACLSSPSLEYLITNGSPAAKLRLLGEKVFSLLILRCYVTKKHMQKCLNTTSQDLQCFAGSSWWFFQKAVSSNIGGVLAKGICFGNADSIKKFSGRVEQERNKWDFFKDLRLSFFYRPKATRSENDRSNLNEAAISLLKKFGKYITHVRWKDLFSGNQQLHDICPDLHIILPRLKQLYWTIETNDLPRRSECHFISLELTDRTLEPIFTLSGNFCVPQITSVNTSEENIHRCHIDSSILKNPVQLVASEQLKIYMNSPYNIVESYDDVLDADLSISSTVRSLIVDGFTHHLMSIPILEKFPNVTNVVFTGTERADLHVDAPRQELVFPKVKKVTLGVTQKTVPQMLDILPKHFPLVRNLTIRNNETDVSMRALMYSWRSQDPFNQGVIDVYRLYSENLSLKESNIWNEMSHLTTLCINVAERFEMMKNLLGVDGKRVAARRRETYRKIETGRILLDITVSE